MVLRALLCRRSGDYFGAVAREALGCCKQSLMGHSGGNIEDQNAERSADSGNPAQKAWEGTRCSIENWLEAACVTF